MSRQIQMNNRQMKSFSRNFINNDNSDSSLESTELQAQNSQLQFDNINRTETLGQMSKENNEIKKKYEALLHEFSNQQSNSANTYPSPNPTKNTVNSTHFFENMTQSFLPDERAEREVQLWTEMWTHIVSMISNVIPYSNAEPRTGNERRAILVDLISRLCQIANDPTSAQYSSLLQKYKKTKEKLNYFQNQQSELTNEINKYKQLLNQKNDDDAVKDEEILAKKIKTLEGLLYKLIEKQRHLQIDSTNFSFKPSTENQSLFASKEKTQIFQQPKEQQPQIQHRIIQCDEDSDEEASSDDNFDQNYNSHNSSKMNNYNEAKSNNNVLTRSFSKVNHTFNIANRKNKEVNNKSNKNKASAQKSSAQSISKRLGLDEISGISSSIENRKTYSKKTKKKNISLYENGEISYLYSNESSDNNQDSSYHDDNLNDNYRQQLMSAEAEADEILAKSSRRRRNKSNVRVNNLDYKQKIKRKSNTDANSISRNISKKNRSRNEDGNEIRRNYGNHINQLVHLTNHLTDDYHKLGKYLGCESNGAELSLSHLSRCHDSLLSAEKQLNDISD